MTEEFLFLIIAIWGIFYYNFVLQFRVVENLPVGI
jgi:hypothetical protein